MCRLVCPSEMQPEIVDTSQLIGTVTSRAAEAVSVGVVRREEMMIMYGSITFLSKPQRHASMWVGEYTLKGLYCNSGGMVTTGLLTRWPRDTMASVIGEL